MKRKNAEQKRKGDNQEISFVQARLKDVLPEEFPEGPYGAAAYNDQPPGKSSPWQEGQQVVSRFQDENPDFSDFTVPSEKPPE